MTHTSGIPRRFVLFGAACAGWAAALTSDAAPSVVADAGRAWFAVWSVQVGISVASWVWPFSFPESYYQTRRASSLPGLGAFRRAAHAIHPFTIDRRSLDRLAAITRGAETTHTISFVGIVVAAVAVAAAGGWRLAWFATVWNVLFNLYPAVLQRNTRARLAGSLPPSPTPAATTGFPSGSGRLRARHRTA